MRIWTATLEPRIHSLTRAGEYWARCAQRLVSIGPSQFCLFEGERARVRREREEVHRGREKKSNMQSQKTFLEKVHLMDTACVFLTKKKIPCSVERGAFLTLNSI